MSTGLAMMRAAICMYSLEPNASVYRFVRLSCIKSGRERGRRRAPAREVEG